MTAPSKYIKAPLIRSDLGRYCDAEFKKLESGIANTIDYFLQAPWIDAVQYYGLVGDGNKDNSSVFSKIFSGSGKALFFRRGDYITHKFTIPSGTLIYFEPGTIIRDAGLLGTNERFINIINDDVYIIGRGAKILMDRADYTSGEQRHGVFIFGARNVIIDGLESSDSGGDGFYVGGNTSDPATNIKLLNCLADNNRRQGYSLVSADNFYMDHCSGTNTTGTGPSAGLDIEPNNTSDILNNIVIKDCYFANNDGAGIAIFLGNWNAAANFADIRIIRPLLKNNAQAFQTGDFNINRLRNTTQCTGQILIEDLTSIAAEHAGLRIINWDKGGTRIKVVRPFIYEANQSGGSASNYSPQICLYNDETYTTTPGNVEIIEPKVEYSGSGAAPINITNAGSLSTGWQNVNIYNPDIIASAWGNPIALPQPKTVRVFRDVEQQVAFTANFSITDGRYFGRTLTNLGATGSITVSLPQVTSDRIGWRFTFEVFAAQTFGLGPNGSDKIVPLADGAAAGTSIKSSTIGSRITIEAKQTGYWHIVDISGLWVINPASGPQTYSASNVTSDRTYDANSTTLDEVADILGTLINDLRDQGIVR